MTARLYRERFLTSLGVGLTIVSTGAFMACSSTAKKDVAMRAPAATNAGTNKATGPYEGHGSASLPAETIAKFAPPALQNEVARKIQSMLDVKAPGLGVVSPDGQHLYFGWSVSGTPQVWRADGPRSFPQQMTGGSDSTAIQGITPDGRWLIISRDRNGEENPGLYLQSPNGGALQEIFHQKGVRASLNWIGDDSRYLYYTANDVKPDSYVIYKYDINLRTREIVFDQPGLWVLGDVRADGLLLLAKQTGSLSSEWSTYEQKSKSLQAVIGQGEREEYEVSFGPRAGEYLVLTNKLGNFRRLYRLNDGKLQALTNERPMDVESFRIDHPRKRVLVEWNDQGFTRLEAYDARTFKPLALPKFTGADHLYIGTISHDGRYATIGVETSKAPRVSYVYDWKLNKLTQWVLPSAPETDTSSFSEAKPEFYPARDGTQIPMLVRRPANCAKKPCPVIVHFHGGPEGQSRPGFNASAQIFIDAGFIFVEPNVRGSEGYGKAWLSSDDAAKRLQVITDIEDAATYIKKAWAVDGVQPKIGIMGGSYGGYSTLMGMTRFAGSYNAGVAIVGMSNLVTFLMNTAPYRRILRISEYGDPEKDREALLQLSPITHLNRVRDPLLIIQGVSDPRVPAGEAVQMYEAMQKKGLASQLILFADEGHGSIKRENRVLELGHTLAFFQRHLQDKP